MLSFIITLVLCFYAARSIHTPNIPGYRPETMEEARYVGKTVRKYFFKENLAYAVHPELAGLWRAGIAFSLLVGVLLPIIVVGGFSTFIFFYLIVAFDIIIFNLERWLNATFWNSEWQKKYANGRNFPNKIS